MLPSRKYDQFKQYRKVIQNVGLGADNLDPNN